MQHSSRFTSALCLLLCVFKYLLSVHMFEYEFHEADGAGLLLHDMERIEQSPQMPAPVRILCTFFSCC